MNRDAVASALAPVAYVNRFTFCTDVGAQVSSLKTVFYTRSPKSCIIGARGGGVCHVDLLLVPSTPRARQASFVAPGSR
jgi:hypothetical protein